jgi:hypothetical protein
VSSQICAGDSRGRAPWIAESALGAIDACLQNRHGLALLAGTGTGAVTPWLFPLTTGNLLRKSEHPIRYGGFGSLREWSAKENPRHAH